MIDVASGVIAVFAIQGVGLIENDDVAIVGLLGLYICHAGANIFKDARLGQNILLGKHSQAGRAPLNRIFLFLLGFNSQHCIHAQMISYNAVEYLHLLIAAAVEVTFDGATA